MNEEIKEASGQKRIQLSTFLEAVTAANVLFPAAIVCLSVAGFALGFRLHGWVLLIAALVTVFALRLFTTSWRMAGIVAGASLGLLVIAFVLACHFFDDSWDGLAYHQDAILCLNEGWNPVYEQAESYGASSDSIWEDHYPKASWIFSAAIFKGSGYIESGKLLNFTLMVAAAAQLAAVLLRLTSLRGWIVALLAALAALNPVAIYQSTTFYVDGLMASLLTILVSVFTLYLAKPRWPTLSIGLAAMCLAINLKFTGLVYVAILLVATVIVAFCRNGARVSWRLAITGTLAGLFGTCVIGYSPYVRNICENGNIFYPAIGSHHQLDMNETTPANLVEHNRIMRFLISNFSRSGSVRPPHSTELKFPFWIYGSERSAWSMADVEAAGFGPLFGGLLVLSIIGLCLLAADRSCWNHLTIAALIGGALLLSAFSHKETWWARYVPQIWLLPLLIAVPCLLSPQRLGQRWIGWALIGLMSINVLFVGYYFVRSQQDYSHRTCQALHEMAAAPQPITVYLGPFNSLRQRLREAGVQFQMISIAPDPATRDAVWHPIPSPREACWTTNHNVLPSALP